jgi:hypothetical protein
MSVTKQDWSQPPWSCFRQDARRARERRVL